MNDEQILVCLALEQCLEIYHKSLLLCCKFELTQRFILISFCFIYHHLLQALVSLVHVCHSLIGNHRIIYLSPTNSILVFLYFFYQAPQLKTQFSKPCIRSFNMLKELLQMVSKSEDKIGYFQIVYLLVICDDVYHMDLIYSIWAEGFVVHVT